MTKVFGSRGKGSNAELEVCVMLEGWWRRVESDAKWARTPGSGGWGRPAVRAGFRASGDLMTDAKKFPFVVEVKRREGWSWKPLLAGKPSPIWRWWVQAQTAAAEMQGEPLLIWRKNREPWWVMLREAYARERRLHTVGVDVRWQGRERAINAGAHPRALPADFFFAFAPQRFVGSVSARRHTPNGETAGKQAT